MALHPHWLPRSRLSPVYRSISCTPYPSSENFHCSLTQRPLLPLRRLCPLLPRALHSASLSKGCMSRHCPECVLTLLPRPRPRKLSSPPRRRAPAGGRGLEHLSSSLVLLCCTTAHSTRVHRGGSPAGGNGPRYVSCLTKEPRIHYASLPFHEAWRSF